MMFEEHLSIVSWSRRYLKKFQIPRRMITRIARRAIIVSLCKNEELKSRTVCNHANLNTVFTIYSKERRETKLERNPKLGL